MALAALDKPVFRAFEVADNGFSAFVELPASGADGPDERPLGTVVGEEAGIFLPMKFLVFRCFLSFYVLKVCVDYK